MVADLCQGTRGFDLRAQTKILIGYLRFGYPHIAKAPLDTRRTRREPAGRWCRVDLIDVFHPHDVPRQGLQNRIAGHDLLRQSHRERTVEKPGVD